MRAALTRLTVEHAYWASWMPLIRSCRGRGALLLDVANDGDGPEASRPQAAALELPTGKSRVA